MWAGFPGCLYVESDALYTRKPLNPYVLGCAGNPVFEDAAVRALERLWAMRSPLNLLGSSLDMVQGQWKDASGGIGASSDSFYEYLLKAYILFGEDPFPQKIAPEVKNTA